MHYDGELPVFNIHEKLMATLPKFMLLASLIYETVNHINYANTKLKQQKLLNAINTTSGKTALVKILVFWSTLEHETM